MRRWYLIEWPDSFGPGSIDLKVLNGAFERAGIPSYKAIRGAPYEPSSEVPKDPAPEATEPAVPPFDPALDDPRPDEAWRDEVKGVRDTLEAAHAGKSPGHWEKQVFSGVTALLDLVNHAWSHLTARADVEAQERAERKRVQDAFDTDLLDRVRTLEQRVADQPYEGQLKTLDLRVDAISRTQTELGGALAELRGDLDERNDAARTGNVNRGQVLAALEQRVEQLEQRETPNHPTLGDEVPRPGLGSVEELDLLRDIQAMSQSRRAAETSKLRDLYHRDLGVLLDRYQKEYL